MATVVENLGQKLSCDEPGIYGLPYEKDWNMLEPTWNLKVMTSWKKKHMVGNPQSWNSM